MTLDEAIDIARKIFSKDIDIPQNDEIICTYYEDTDEGWYLECNSRVFTETDDLTYALVITPILIRSDGTHRFVY